MTKKTIEEDSWNRYPEARVRMREDGLKTLLEGLGEDGFCHGGGPRFHLLDDGIYVEILLNVGKFGDIVALPLEIFIPADTEPPKKKVSKKKAAALAAAAATTVVVEPVEVKVVVPEPNWHDGHHSTECPDANVCPEHAFTGGDCS